MVNLTRSVHDFIPWGVLLWMLGCPSHVCGFNVDTGHPILFEGPKGSKFGFTVANFITRFGEKRILAGAPEAETAQPGVKRPGAVYECRADNSGCYPMAFDNEGNAIGKWNHYEKIIENKTEQWFGSSLATSKDLRSVIACAPRYVFHTLSLVRKIPIGRCSIMTKGAVYHVRPCYEETKNQMSLYGPKSSCMAGTSAALTEDENFFIIGSAGSYYLQGQLYLMNTTTVLNETEKGSIELDDSYKGWSMDTGHFDDDRIRDYVTGAPRAANLNGSIYIYTQELEPLGTYLGDQTGEAFGYSVVVADFNDDGRDDIAVGAPFYFEKPTYETGRVCILYQEDQHRFEVGKNLCIKGSKTSGSRFGTALAAVGDINKDYIQDLAVGAPYDGPDGQGAVYLFHGGPVRLNPQPAQVIFASEVHSGLSGFGFSLTGGSDYDENGYPDLIVGAYGSDQAVLLLTRPVVDIKKPVLRFRPEIINLEDTSLCQYEGRAVTCIVAEVCMYLQKAIANQGDLRFQFNITSDYLKNPHTRRAFFLMPPAELTSTYNKTLYADRCDHRYVIIDPYGKLKDRWTPISFELEYKLDSASASAQWGIQPILAKSISTKVYAQTLIQRDCGDDNVCRPDLMLSLSSPAGSPFVFGSTMDFSLQIDVHNLGEDAFMSTLTLTFPPGISFTGIRKIVGYDDPICGGAQRVHSLSPLSDLAMTCEIGNPFPAMDNGSYVMALRIKNVNTSLTHILFSASVQSANAELNATLGDNMNNYSLPVSASVDIRLDGVSDPSEIVLNSSHYEEMKRGGQERPRLKHVYNIRNSGPSAASNLTTRINIPLTIVGDLPLFNLTKLPAVAEKKGVCKLVEMEPRHSVALALASREEGATVKDSPPGGTVLFVNCKSLNVQHCGQIRCITEELERDENIQIEVHLELIISTLQAIQGDFKSVQVTAEAHTSVGGVPYNVVADSLPHVFTKVMMTLVGPAKAGLALWIIIVSVCCGVLLLIIVTVLLWKCGFFRRQRVADVHGKEQTRAISGMEEEFAWSGGTEKLQNDMNENQGLCRDASDDHDTM